MKFKIGDKVKHKRIYLAGEVEDVSKIDEENCILNLKGVNRDFGIDEFEKIEELEELERVKIPRFVAEFIDINKRNGALIGNVLEPGYPTKEVEKWLYQSSKHSDHVKKQYLFFKAWMEDDYEIEEEQLYYVKLYDFVAGYLNLTVESGTYFVADKKQTDAYKTKFTEQEIKAYDERHWAFAVKVEDDDK